MTHRLALGAGRLDLNCAVPSTYVRASLHWLLHVHWTLREILC